jgi:hypothetical protein
MTEIQWLCDILLNHKLAGPVKDRFIARIGEVEAKLNMPTNHASVKPSFNGSFSQPVQSPSTQKILDEIEMGPPQPAAQPRMIIPQEVITSKGNGTNTRGPRKF